MIRPGRPSSTRNEGVRHRRPVTVLSAEIHVSHRVSARPRRLQPVRKAAFILGVLGLAALPMAPLATAAGGLTVTTPFPAVVAEPGSTASFALTITVPNAMRVDLRASGVPDGWTARFRGGGLTIDGAFVEPKTPQAVTLDVEIPDGIGASSNNITVTASGGGLTDVLPLTIRVADAAAGDVTLSVESPELSGPSGTTFTYSITINNDTAAEIPFTPTAEGPAGWTVTAKPGGAAQATSTTVAPGGTGTMTVTATPPNDVTAGTYPLKATASGGGKTASIDLAVTITGTFALTLSTPDQVLSTTANAGTLKEFQLTVVNSGTAPVTNLVMQSNAPTNWKVEFVPANVPTIAAGQSQAITAQITPSGDAIAGDYEMTLTAKATEASDNVTIRVRVETPQFWWIVGVALIVAVFAGLYWVFRTYGRR
jgi:uncharacterized membrane protein